MGRDPLAPPTPLAKPVDDIPAGSLTQLRRDAAACRRCPLWRDATRTVFGRGPARARLMLIGEQPGAQEDLQGRPFVGPAGRLLREALAEVGLDPADLYMTNTVKHFKYTPRGKARLHKRANEAEQAACRPWLAAELARLRPRVVIALGAMAAGTMFGSGFRLTRERGQWRPFGPQAEALATWHPSAILRMRGEDRAAARADLLGDLAAAARRLADQAR
ncbi:UdgX family uracil-DNA binding protein [Luteimonas kalidii]|uniref:Type-4 uracil-DNA glycosylase n=1 Tax=Luteimonas kalidii TaxID=3042025 RepID=A0ABT6JY84_9GAMM|nr:UdgX family uracil-DNA binding protein [Luteimonas kalidii]MDH5835654.1 UdgX family uracil-DNA binding protein [Luteimonas kalidii]